MLRDSGAAAIPDFMPDTHFERNFGSIPFYSSNAVPTQKLEKPEQIRLDADSCNIIGTVFNTYIIVQQNDAVYYIDQHAAHERLLYEKLVAGELRFCSQLLVMPDYVKLDPVAYSCLEDNLERIEELGFSVELCGELTIRIYAVPDILNFNIVNGRTQNGRGIESFLNEAIAIIEENGSVDETELVRSKLIKASCKHAVKGGDMLDEQQVKALVQSYCGGNVPLTCPHGRPVIISVKNPTLKNSLKGCCDETEDLYNCRPNRKRKNSSGDRRCKANERRNRLCGFDSNLPRTRYRLCKAICSGTMRRSAPPD